MLKQEFRQGKIIAATLIAVMAIAVIFSSPSSEAASQGGKPCDVCQIANSLAGGNSLNLANYPCRQVYRGVEQLVTRPAHARKIAGSNPAAAIILCDRGCPEQGAIPNRTVSLGPKIMHIVDPFEVAPAAALSCCDLGLTAVRPNFLRE